MVTPLLANTPKNYIGDWEGGLYKIVNDASIKSLEGKISIENKTFKFSYKKENDLKINLDSLNDSEKEIYDKKIREYLSLYFGLNSIADYVGENIRLNKNTIHVTSDAVDESNETLLEFDKKQLKVIEKKPSGTVTSQYYYNLEKNNKKYLTRVVKISYVGAQNYKVEMGFQYEAIGRYQFIKKININYEQNVTNPKSTKDMISRKISEEVGFSEIIIK